MSRFDKYMVIPFVKRGRTSAGVDCFGMVALVLIREAGIAPHDPGVGFHGNAAEVEAALAAELARGHWHRVDVPQQFDAVVLKGYCGLGRSARSGEFHFGIMIDDRNMLHTEEHSGPRVVALSDPEVVGRVRFFCRPDALVRRAAA